MVPELNRALTEPKLHNVLTEKEAGGKKKAALRITVGRQVVLHTRSIYVSHTTNNEKRKQKVSALLVQTGGVAHALFLCVSTKKNQKLSA